MFGVYAWVGGASSAMVLADVVRLVTGGDVAGCSVACNKSGSSVSGVASSWSSIDAAFGVVRHAGLGSGPGVLARLQISGVGRLQLAVVDGWDPGPHTATHWTSGADVSLLLSSAGSISFVCGDGVLAVASSDWSVWAIAAEVRRDGPAMFLAQSRSGAIVIASSGSHYMARVKNPGSAGETSNAFVSVQSAFGSLSGASARDHAEQLYLPMAPATVAYSQVPVEEVAGVMLVGGYGQSGDSVLVDPADTFVIHRSGGSLFAVLKE